ncbi:hypothetical protein HP567_028145 [Brevibacillus sp. M2.1A]|nr:MULTISPECIES: hypothetical protein [Brevibacillus]MBY0087102.1 hypothetical protein [Brevibacillus brevis]MCC8438412.1 hypothetical protein [Brevibacillus sp. M2.1A]MCE0453483.1 hypothetical protein [Brevibacillus sp. AF8]
MYADGSNARRAGKMAMAPHDVASSKLQATRSLLGGYLPWMPCQMK